ncbi:hypothetical protein SAMN04488519_103234 [Algoriphagus ornithinivorans]|uniref:Uncharacterized protein n=1 Tax=Algoriphagus ornithinivorans TaxID=226506 RepID=A0A1I5E0W6_9BACT|nr:hypothetical protein [Algoriphagus ornithinivorans]SFO05102.1 hypothetical protein SAMN04488519_103234 [Algoriphagus ornithinivorans]
MKNKLVLYIFSVLFSSVWMACSSSDKGEGNEAENNSLISEVAMDPNAQAGALPYTIEFEEQNFPGKAPLPRLQSFGSAVNQAGEIFMVGGRRQGLHTFDPFPAHNFVKDSANNFLFVIDPSTGDQWSFNVKQLSAEFSAPLQATNLQTYHDKETDYMYVVGGYGWKADSSDMVTFGSVIQFQLEAITKAIKGGASAQDIQGLMKIGKDDRLAITGGVLSKSGETFQLIFGQRFDGQYRAFGGTDFKQKYSNQIRNFRLNPQNLSISAYGAETNSGWDQPFHRRDGNIIESVDPKSGAQIMTALGGVFKPGIIGGYDYPIFISGPSNVSMDSTVHQKFSQYECPVITIYNPNSQDTSVYHTMFGGISLFYYNQTPSQKAAFDKVTAQGRNDGLPFISDISVFQRNATGQYQEYILPNPIPNNRLLGSSTNFIPNRALVGQGLAFENGVLDLSKVAANDKVLVGYIFGGIEAAQPLPLVPNEGTSVSNSLFAVYVTNSSSAAIPAALAIKARTGPPLTERPR